MSVFSKIDRALEPLTCTVSDHPYLPENDEHQPSVRSIASHSKRAECFQVSGLCVPVLNDAGLFYQLGEDRHEGVLTVHALEQALCKILNMLDREWSEGILFEKVEHAHSVQLGHEARVTPVIKVLLQMDTFAGSISHAGTEMAPSRVTHLRLCGSCFFNVSSTLISILLASRYFWTARMTLIATFFLVSICLASTTLPKVP
jgi:hypothetical protein